MISASFCLMVDQGMSAGPAGAQVDRQAYLNDLFAHHPEGKHRWKEPRDQIGISELVPTL